MKQLKCNFPPCEAVIAGSGFVTKCRFVFEAHANIHLWVKWLTLQHSHVFCMKCAANNGLAAESSLSSRKCPVCQKPLQQRLDTHEHSLSPPDGWKDLVLAGLAPKDILDCAGRALGFWQYQISTH
ncbi:hypothetical protein QBC46DRAFT_250939 [Diplogelasinospora grovesii]|uniref:Uncharacterized protein n=1 Tax=Diplogelasinospora grovesii TaxID=303347 RepID=A0AAN6NJJ3_9PEZI|nr:hypothetical protein QBC46DRAFT_250939 [Diplogelasinospora grovesii]